MSQNLEIGTPQYGSKKKNNWRIGDGDNVYRILPPLGKLASKGTWAVFEALHWGYRGSKGMRPFRCIQKKNPKTGMILVQCPECDKIAEYLALKDATIEKKMAEGLSEEEAKEVAKPMSDWLFSHNLDKGWHVNAMKEDGSIGRLTIKHKLYQALQVRIEKLRKEDVIDPIAVNEGVWFILTRTGRGNQTAFNADVQYTQEMVNGRKVKVIKPAPLTEDVLARIATEAFDLSDSFRTLKYDEIKRLVDSGGDPEEVDHVFSSPEDAEGEEPEPESGATANVQPVNVLANLAKKIQEPKLAPKSDEEDIEAQIRAEVQARLAAKKASGPAPQPQKAAEPESDEDFIKKYGLKIQ